MDVSYLMAVHTWHSYKGTCCIF